MLKRFDHDHCPFSIEDQEQRLLPALKLSEARIPCIIYGEDALVFAHFVPTLQFNFHRVVVADSKKDVAAALIADSFDLKSYTGGRELSHESILADATRPLIYPHSAHLEVPPSGPLNESTIVLIHPQSFFNLDVDDYSRSTPLPPFPDNIRFPTLPAFLDSMFDTLLDPNWGHCSQRGGRALTLWISYIFDYKLRQNPLLLPNGDLAPEVAKLKSSLKLENQQPFELWVRKKFTYKTAFDIRRDVLRKMGRLDLANRQYRRMWREIEHTF
ncbi:hypothetical protein CPC08DRAFT_691708 [Agrocybe pediades]|nr:hypothetical protein CPC08DRAFT_691708 [Agrocybe pediades]